MATAVEGERADRERRMVPAGGVCVLAGLRARTGACREVALLGCCWTGLPVRRVPDDGVATGRAAPRDIRPPALDWRATDALGVADTGEDSMTAVGATADARAVAAGCVAATGATAVAAGCVVATGATAVTDDWRDMGTLETGLDLPRGNLSLEEEVATAAAKRWPPRE